MIEPEEQTEIEVHERDRRQWGLLIPLAAILVIVFIFSIHWKRSLKVRHIEVEGLHALAAQEIVAASGVRMNSSLQETDLAGVQRQLMSEPFVKSASVTRHFPDALRISILEREPIASVNGGQMWYVDAAGVILPFRQSGLKLDLPIISGVVGLQNARAGDVVTNREISQAVELLARARSIDSSLYHFISEVNMNHGGDITLFSVDAGAPIILGRGGVARKLYLLQAFWSNVVRTRGVEQLQSIDLRYDDQVVVRWVEQADKPPSRVSL
jgi:cell division protein FtsQ